jgi:hypothetical protein
LEHALGVREVTALRVVAPFAAPPSGVLQAAERTGAVAFRRGPEHLLEIGFDGEAQGQRSDLRPALPLVLCW